MSLSRRASVPSRKRATPGAAPVRTQRVEREPALEKLAEGALQLDDDEEGDEDEEEDDEEHEFPELDVEEDDEEDEDEEDEEEEDEDEDEEGFDSDDIDNWDDSDDKGTPPF